MDQNNPTNSNNQEPNIVKPDEVVKPEPVMQPMDNPVIQPEPIQPEPVMPQPIPQIVKPDAGARPEDSIKPAPVAPQAPVAQPAPVEPTVAPTPEVTPEPSVHPMQQDPSTVVTQNVQQPVQGQPMQQPVQQNMQSQPNNPNNWFNPQPNNQGNNNYNPFNQPQQPVNKKSRMNLKKILMIIGGAFVGIILLVVILFVFVFSTSKKMVCKSDEGDITLMYNSKKLTGYVVDGITFDMDEAEKSVEKYGIDEYLVIFNQVFETETTGTCTINGKKVERKLQTIGDDDYGYMEVPSNWEDNSEKGQIIYEYGNYRYTIGNVGKGNSAETYATAYYEEMTNKTSNLKASNVTIGEDEYYTYYIYAYIESANSYSWTFWFETKDGNVRYIILEGEEDATRFLNYVNTFRLDY